MSNELDIILIDQYLSNELGEAEKSKFAARLASEAEFKNQYEEHLAMLQAVSSYGRSLVKAELLLLQTTLIPSDFPKYKPSIKKSFWQRFKNSIGLGSITAVMLSSLLYGLSVQHKIPNIEGVHLEQFKRELEKVNQQVTPDTVYKQQIHYDTIRTQHVERKYIQVTGDSVIVTTKQPPNTEVVNKSIDHVYVRTDTILSTSHKVERGYVGKP